jgi:hypothetical protein
MPITPDQSKSGSTEQHQSNITDIFDNPFASHGMETRITRNGWHAGRRPSRTPKDEGQHYSERWTILEEVKEVKQLLVA